VAGVARPLRIVYPGALYHLIARGNNRERCFCEEDDFLLFLEILEHVLERFSWLLYAYCLMGNHYHLEVETPLPNLPAGMRQLNGLYARGFNRRQGRCGHVFQARYRAILIERETHLREVARYIVLNPVRAGISADPGEYRWSSYRATLGEAEPEVTLALGPLLALFAEEPALARVRYREFVREGIAEALAERVRGERLGSEAFLRERFGHEPPLPEIPRLQVEPLPPSLEELFAHEPLPVATAYRRHGYTIGQIAEYLGCHYSTVSRRLRREEEMANCKT
jgi:REP-associated tyrosine transposase